ncbi:hypothetical protein WA026_015649 [Henosepilachna vigintioctopunctata]|uniref:Lipase n=1 Tax=Henosepilachna vigintioctopunctata TaxID=420089 RepID=A0AAW1VEP0_9CUCU
MRILVLLCLCPLFGMNNSLPFSNEIENELEKNQYLRTMPLSREEIRAVKSKLNLTLDDDNADEYLSVLEIISKYGYPAEEHFVQTSDGYILRMHRIPPTKSGIKPCNRTIFLMHGLLSSSADWILLGPKKALPYHLANLGYDVWMGNARGNTQSRNHTKMSPNDSEFWKFSWHEIGILDVPAMIDYALKISKQSALYHIGHSQGTTTFYVMCSELPEYNKKIIAHYSFAPVAYMTHAYSPILRFAAKFIGSLEVLSSLFGINELLPHNSLTVLVNKFLCKLGEITHFLCENFLFMLTGFDAPEFDESMMPTLLAHSPSGASARQVFHYGQLIDSGGFNKYDYAPFNAFHYGIFHPLYPPSYKLGKIDAPVYLYYSLNDWLSDPRDVERICNELGNCKAKTLVAEKMFNHLDFIFAIHAKERLYELVTDDIEKHAKNKH